MQQLGRQCWVVAELAAGQEICLLKKSGSFKTSDASQSGMAVTG